MTLIFFFNQQTSFSSQLAPSSLLWLQMSSSLETMKSERSSPLDDDQSVELPLSLSLEDDESEEEDSDQKSEELESDEEDEEEE